MYLSIIITAHAEGPLLAQTLKSVFACVDQLRTTASEVEVIAVLDRPSLETIAVTRKSIIPLKVIEVDFGDVALTRNAGLAKATGDFVALLDGDDLWGSSWLSSALSLAKSDHKAIFHPQFSYYFGYAVTKSTHQIMEHVSSTDESFSKFLLCFDNYWTSSLLAHKSIFELVHYRSNDKTKRIAYEDWGFSLESHSKGFEHKVVPGTVHFIRSKPSNSVLTSHRSLNPVPYPLVTL